MSIQQIENNEVGSSVRGKLNDVITAVNGIDPPGLVAGSSASTLRNADFLVAAPAQAAGQYAIALGDDARATEAGLSGAVAIGFDARAANGGVAMGRRTRVSGRGIALSFDANASGTAAIQMMEGTASGSNAIGLQFGTTNGERSVKLGHFSSTGGGSAVCIGNTSSANTEGISIGRNIPSTTGNRHIRIGFTSTTTGDNAIAIGSQAAATAAGAVAIGEGVTAATADWTTTKALQLVNYATLDFADDAAAESGGVPLGGLYHTSGVVKIRII